MGNFGPCNRIYSGVQFVKNNSLYLSCLGSRNALCGVLPAFTGHGACLFCNDVRGNPNATEWAELCVRVPCSSRSVAWGQLFDPKEGPTVPRRLLGFLSDKNHGAWLVEKPGGDPRLDSPVRHGLLDFRQQSVAGAPGGCECVARRSVVQHGQNLIQLFPWHRDETFDIVEVIASVQYRVLSEEGNVT